MLAAFSLRVWRLIVLYQVHYPMREHAGHYPSLPEAKPLGRRGVAQRI